jgi:SAM-dependent methyltransferase
VSGDDSAPFLSTVDPWQAVAGGYVEVTRVELAPYSADAIELVAPAAGARALDVACGPGTLSLQLAPRVAHVTAVDFSKNMLAHLRRAARAAAIDNVEAHLMDGQRLELDNASFDAAFSMFGLMFFPDRGRGFAELRRTLVPGGRVAVSTWGPIDESPAMRVLVGALRAAVPKLPEGGSISALDSADKVRGEMVAAGFDGVEVHRVSHSWAYQSAAEAWRVMERGSAPVVMLAAELGDAWPARSRAAVEHLERALDFPVELEQTALIGVATRPPGPTPA